jgi:hypothetical protein
MNGKPGGRTMRYIIILIVVLFAASCNRNSVARSDREITLQVGETAAIDNGNLLITFNEVTEDSRCPVDVVCIWAGNGAAALKLETSEQTDTITLNTLQEPQTRKFEGYEITLKDLQPYPQENVVIDPNEYEIMLQISKD